MYKVAVPSQIHILLLSKKYSLTPTLIPSVMYHSKEHVPALEFNGGVLYTTAPQRQGR